MDRLTLSEIACLLEEPSGPRPHGGRGGNQSAEEMALALAGWGRMGPRERLERARREG